MEIGLGIDSRFTLSEEDHRSLAREAKALGYESLWTPIGASRVPFDVCATWTQSSDLGSGIAVVPLSAWSIDALGSVANETFERCERRFTLGIGAGRITDAPIRFMRTAALQLRSRLSGVPLYLGALGPQMLRLAGERYEGAALNWCSTEQVAWSRDRVAEGARATGRDPREIRIHEYIRVCVDDDEPSARLAFAKMVMYYALAPTGTDRKKGYRAHFARMGFDDALAGLEERRDRGVNEDELARLFPPALLREVGYWGPADGAREALGRLADGLDIAVVRLVPARRNDAEAVRVAMRACAPAG